MDHRVELAEAEALQASGDFRGAVRRAAACFEAVLRDACRQFPAAGPARGSPSDPAERLPLAELVLHAVEIGVLGWLNASLSKDEVATRLVFWQEVARMAEASERLAAPRTPPEEDGGINPDARAAPGADPGRSGAAGATDPAAAGGAKAGGTGGDELGAMEAQMVLSALRVLLREAGWLEPAGEIQAEATGEAWAIQPDPPRTRDRNGLAAPDSLCGLNSDEVWERSFKLGLDVVMALVWVPPGEFWMGSPEGEAGQSANEMSRRRVLIPRGFWLGKYAVTQRQWKAVMHKNPAVFQDVGLDAPVENVSWGDCKSFILVLNSLLKTGKLRLPSEEEWEYACRAGTTTPFAFGSRLTAGMAHFGCVTAKQDRGKKQPAWFTPFPVGCYPPNAWGLYDMHGNVWEWCETVYTGGSEDERASEDGWEMVDGWEIDDPRRVIRGGAWDSDELRCRSAARDWWEQDDSSDNTGFRLACGP